MTFIIEGKPQGKGRPRFYRGHAVTPEETKEYEKKVEQGYRDAGGDIIDGYVAVCIKAFYPIPKATSKIKREMINRGLIKPATKPDIDNVLKIILDGLNRVAYHDDNQVVRVTAQKFYAENPFVVVEVYKED